MTRVLVVRFDVTELTEAEAEFLAGEVAAQADRSEGHPSVPEPTITIEDVA